MTMETRIGGNLSELYEEYRHTNAQLVVRVFEEELKPKDGECRRSTVTEVMFPMTPLSREVAVLITETGLRIFSMGGQAQDLDLHVLKRGELKSVHIKHGQKELIRISRETYLLIWLAILDRHHQLNWNLRSVYPIPLIKAYEPYINLSLAELELWRETLKYHRVSDVLGLVGVDGYKCWFLTSNEWQVEHCLKTLAERPLRESIKFWSNRCAVLRDGKNPFTNTDGEVFRFRLMEAALYVRRNFSGDENYKTFLKHGWVPYVDAINEVSKSIKTGIKFGGETIKYRTPIIKGLTITTSEDPSKKIPLKKSKERLHQRGNYDRENT
jgi:hypothetical protein